MSRENGFRESIFVGTLHHTERSHPMVRPTSRTPGMVVGVVLGALLCLANWCVAQGNRVIERREYESRCRAMWLGEAIGNWTGLPIENAYYNPPFLTDVDWGMPLPGNRRLDFVFQ